MPEAGYDKILELPRSLSDPRVLKLALPVALGELKSVTDLYDFQRLSVLFLIGFVFIFPIILNRKRTYE